MMGKNLHETLEVHPKSGSTTWSSPDVTSVSAADGQCSSEWTARGAQGSTEARSLERPGLPDSRQSCSPMQVLRRAGQGLPSLSFNSQCPAAASQGAGVAGVHRPPGCS